MRRKRIWPVAQNVHVSGQPDCDETQTERRPSRKRISTASMRMAVVRVEERLDRPVGGRRLVRERERRERHALFEQGARPVETFVISAYDAAPRAAHSHTWRVRYGWLGRERLGDEVEVHGPRYPAVRQALLVRLRK